MKKRWQQFRASPLAELISGSAHEAHPTDITSPLGVRFAGQTILALHVALDKAASVRVSFDVAGQPRLSGIRNIRQRASAELGDVLRAEAAAVRTRWVAIVLATGWQAVLGQRAARLDPAEKPSAFARHRLMFETPEVVVPRAQVDRVYTAVDHPVLDKSVVFSVRRRELEDLFGEVRRCGLEVVSVRIGVAAQLEAWLSNEGEAGLVRDVLVTDGLSALLLNVEQGDFVVPHSAGEAEQPRQAVQRPSTIEEDIIRFVAAAPERAVTFLGPEELCAGVKKQCGDSELVRPVAHIAHETQQVTLASCVQHELYFEAREVRPAIHRKWRRALGAYAVIVAALLVVSTVNIVYAVHARYEIFALERQSARQALQLQTDVGAVNQMAAELSDATALRSWISGNYHAQQFCYRVLRDIPASAALDRLNVEIKDGQLALTFVVLGDQENQLGARRAIERAIADLHFKIGGEELPVATAGPAHAVQYRLHIIVPDAAEATST